MAKKGRAAVSNRPRHRKPQIVVETRGFELPKRGIVAYRRPKELTQAEFAEFINQAVNDILARHNINTCVVGLDDWRELRVLNRTEMAKIGFYHQDDIFLLKKDVDLSVYTQEEIEEMMSPFISMDVDEEE